MRIAILEDDPSHMELLSHWLKHAGHVVYPFEHGVELVRTLGRDTFDALLLDWNLPEVSGIEVLRHIRQRLESHVPVIFVRHLTIRKMLLRRPTAGAMNTLISPLGALR